MTTQPGSDLKFINAEQQLYVIQCGAGVTTLGFEFAFKRAVEVARWMKQDDLMPREEDIGTKAGYAAYAKLMAMGAEHSRAVGQRCPAELVPELRGLEGRRVEVIDCYGETRRFRVGRSSGWLPAHLEMHGRRAYGDVVWGTPFQSVKAVAENGRIVSGNLVRPSAIVA